MTLAQDITRHFNGEWQGSQGAFPTPGHSKSDRGMTVKDADGGDVVFYSHNGGDWRAVKDECRRIGLLPDRPRANDNGEGWRETGSYEYVGADGTVVYRTVRKEKAGQRKRFLAQRPDGRGGWTNGLADVERVPYRLPAILAADPDTIVYLTEGERKADKLASWGLVATAVAFGAKGWRDAYGAALADRTVAILPDNDDEGRGFAERAAKSITEAGGRAVFVALPGLSPKGDVMDWTGTADELRALVDAALHAPAETFELADLSQWAATAPTPKAFVMAPFIPRDDVVIVTGDGGTNKSTAALQISACAAAGRQMLGMDVAPGPALYVTAEDDQRENHWRLSKIAAQIGTTLHDLAGRLHIVSLRGRLNNELATFDADGKLRPAPAYALLRATIVATNAKLVTLDNVAHLFAGNENDRSQVTAFINLLYQLCGEFGVTILLIAHRNKAGDSYSGSTAWLNAVRSQILLERSDDTDADVRRMSLGKANYARAGEELTFRWHDFALVRDADLPADRARELAAAAAASGDNMAFLACLREREKQGDGRQVGPSPGPNYAPSQFEGMAQAKGMTKERLKAAMDRLFLIKAIESHTYRNTAKGRDVTVIREASASPRTLTPNASRTPSPNAPEQSARTTPRTHCIPTVYPGAANGAAAPSQEKSESRLPHGWSAPILAPGDEDAPIPGFEDMDMNR